MNKTTKKLAWIIAGLILGNLIGGWIIDVVQKNIVVELPDQTVTIYKNTLHEHEDAGVTVFEKKEQGNDED